MKLHILKITGRDDRDIDVSYFTIKRLRDQILNEWYEVWGEHKEDPQDYTKEQIKESDEDMFDWLNGWGYDIEIILTITENDL